MLEADNGPFVHLDASHEYLTPANARQIAAVMNLLADKAESLHSDPDNSMLYAVKGKSGDDECMEECIVIVSDEWNTTTPMSAPEARVLARQLLDLAHEIDPVAVSRW